MEIDKLKEIFKADKFLAHNDVEILSVENGSVTVGAKILPKHQNALGIVHGAMLFSLADAAFGVLAVHLYAQEFISAFPAILTQSAQINYVAPGKTEYVTATATELIRNGRTCIHQVLIKSKEGNILCTATVNGFIKG